LIWFLYWRCEEGNLAAKWDEVSFTLKPKVGVGEILKAFSKFYYDYNRIAVCGVTSQTYDSGTVGMLLAASDGRTIDSISICVSGSPGGKRITRFARQGKARRAPKIGTN
jgi:hypothetical protein